MLQQQGRLLSAEQWLAHLEAKTEQHDADIKENRARALLSDTNDAEKQMNVVGDGEGGDGGAETMPPGVLELHFRIVLECIFWVV